MKKKSELAFLLGQESLCTSERQNYGKMQRRALPFNIMLDIKIFNFKSLQDGDDQDFPHVTYMGTTKTSVGKIVEQFPFFRHYFEFRVVILR